MDLQQHLSSCFERLDIYKNAYNGIDEELQVQIQRLRAMAMECEKLQQKYTAEKTLRTAAEEDLRDEDTKLERARAVIFLHNLMTPEKLEHIISSDAGFHAYLAQRFSTDQGSIDGETEAQRLETLLAFSEQTNDDYRKRLSAKVKEVEDLKAMDFELVRIRG